MNINQTNDKRSMNANPNIVMKSQHAKTNTSLGSHGSTNSEDSIGSTSNSIFGGGYKLSEQFNKHINKKGSNNCFRNMEKKLRKPRKVDSAIVELLKQPQEIPPEIKTISFKIAPENCIIVQNKNSIYSNVYNKVTFEYAGQKYKSVDDAYQFQKLLQLCGQSFAEQLLKNNITLSKRNFVREIIKECSISKQDIISWRETNGLDVIYEATIQKFMQNTNLLDKMKEDKDKLILFTFGNDPIDSCGEAKDIDQWIAINSGKIIRFPCEQNPDNVFKTIPTISGGKNVQGIMVMLARHYISLENKCMSLLVLYIQCFAGTIVVASIFFAILYFNNQYLQKLRTIYQAEVLRDCSENNGYNNLNNSTFVLKDYLLKRKQTDSWNDSILSRPSLVLTVSTAFEQEDKCEVLNLSSEDAIKVLEECSKKDIFDDNNGVTPNYMIRMGDLERSLTFNGSVEESVFNNEIKSKLSSTRKRSNDDTPIKIFHDSSYI
uniref:NADAR domain-containing protein n=1 Tax=Parastrongyloides trichosuri TaxID=131310 RepID=A0A0N4ZTY6_PARTI